jgi:hypothetical protein
MFNFIDNAKLVFVSNIASYSHLYLVLQVGLILSAIDKELYFILA